MLYRRPLSAGQIAALISAPTLSTLASIVSDLGPSRTTTYLYNAGGQAIASIDPLGNATYTYYDAEGRISGTIDGDGHVTAYTYDADGRVIQTSQYATVVDTSGWLSNGALTSAYPTSLPLPASTAADRVATTVYDAAGNVIATIDPANAVTTMLYDGMGHVLSTTQYASLLTSSQRSALGSNPTLTALQADLTNVGSRKTLTIYDADGRPAASVDAQGYVTVTTYNDASEPVLRTTYATALTTSQLSSLGDTPSLAAVQAELTSSPQDRTTRTYFDGEGRAVAQVDAAGYLTVTAYLGTMTVGTTTVTRCAEKHSVECVDRRGTRCHFGESVGHQYEQRAKRFQHLECGKRNGGRWNSDHLCGLQPLANGRCVRQSSENDCDAGHRPRGGPRDHGDL
jgi:YD repeat-containing protein